MFGDFNGKATSISRDSAFTAQFTVSDYIPDEYTAQALSFSEALPAGTTIIMKADGGYWYYNLGTENASIDLTNFTAMGGTDKFSFNKEKNAAKTFKMCIRDSYRTYHGTGGRNRNRRVP